MNKKFLCILLFLLCLVPCVYSGITGKITGKVTVAETDEALPGANVVLVGTNLGAAADVEGDFFIISIPPGTYTLSVSMLGYKIVNKTGILVSADHTATVNFSLTPTLIEGEAVTVVAERDVIKMDMSASQASLGASDIAEVPKVTSIDEVITMQAGVDVDPTVRGQMTIRGGGRGENGFMVDGLMMVDNRNNRPMMMVNLSAVKEINIIKGGFNAEYGNIRSGLINVVTKEGGKNVYSGSIDFRITPAYQKHRGLSVFDPDNYFLRPYTDPQVCWEGTKAWDEETQDRYPTFSGWNNVYRSLSRKYPGVTPEDAQKLFLWQHRVEGIQDLKFDSLGVNTREAGQYANLPDWNVDVGFGGPVPFISQKLGDLRFFANHRTNKEMFGLPTSRDYFSEQNSQFKLTTNITPSLKVMAEGIYGEIKTLSNNPRGSGMDAFMTSGMDILYSAITTSQDYGLGGNGSLYILMR
ncbi:carboxypeptidase-like regulatory domain-containing protein [candidate division KSB1 bacterium]|nr:carboxypeptidase-like regulatory domain-containing protein [candidate division KSB1 bacterium]